jgi:hypothetical protein
MAEDETTLCRYLENNGEESLALAQINDRDWVEIILPYDTLKKAGVTKRGQYFIWNFTQETCHLYIPDKSDASEGLEDIL